MQSIHFDLEPFDCLVRKEYLFDLQSGFGFYLPCRVIAVSSYPEHLPTFTILVEGRLIFSYLPVHALVSKPCPSLPTQDCSYFNCPTGSLTMHCFTELQRCTVFNRDTTERCQGVYRMTFDWPDGNQLCHLIEEDSGRFLMWPSHKVVFSTGKGVQLPNFKKLHAEWKLK